MSRNNWSKTFKKNKYRIYIGLIGLFLLFILLIFIKNGISNHSLKNYENDILIIKDKNDNQKSFSLKELRSYKNIDQKISLNNNREEVNVTGVPLEQLLGDLSYNLEESPEILVEDSNGKTETLPMSVALEVNRILVVYKINGKANNDYDKALGSFTLIDTTDKSKDSWIKDAKVLSIQ